MYPSVGQVEKQARFACEGARYDLWVKGGIEMSSNVGNANVEKNHEVNMPNTKRNLPPNYPSVR